MWWPGTGGSCRCHTTPTHAPNSFQLSFSQYSTHFPFVCSLGNHTSCSIFQSSLSDGWNRLNPTETLSPTTAGLPSLLDNSNVMTTSEIEEKSFQERRMQRNKALSERGTYVWYFSRKMIVQPEQRPCRNEVYFWNLCPWVTTYCGFQNKTNVNSNFGLNVLLSKSLNRVQVK